MTTWAGKTVVTADGARISLADGRIGDVLRDAGESADVRVWYWVDGQIAWWQGGAGGGEGTCTIDDVPQAARQALGWARPQNERA